MRLLVQTNRRGNIRQESPLLETRKRSLQVRLGRFSESIRKIIRKIVLSIYYLLGQILHLLDIRPDKILFKKAKMI